MKSQRFIPGVLTAMMAGTAVVMAIHPATANSTGAKFYCGNSGGVPATMAVNSRGSFPVIRYLTILDDGKYTPQVRCDIISKRFQEFYDQGTLNFLTTGIKNNLPVVCVAQTKGGACQDLLFTLKPGANPGLTLKRLMDVKSRAAGPLNESSERVYIDMNDFLANAPVEVAAPATPSSATNTSVVPEPSSSTTPAKIPALVGPSETALW